MNRTLFMIGAQLIAFWPVWRWYAVRVGDSADQKWGLLALLTALLFVLSKRASVHVRSLTIPTLIVVLYVVTYPVFPPLARAAVAFTAIAVTVSVVRFGKPFHPGVLGLLWLSLPLVPSLQFYLGYPLRLLVAGLAAPILRLGGFAVIQEGTCLNWAGQLIWIDAPCSGVRMLWVGLYLTFTLVCFYELRLFKTLVLLLAALLTIIAGNVFRAIALFYLESGVFPMPAWAHDYTGIVTFALVGTGIVAAVHFIRREKLCGELLST
ncbi:MAG TPA: archaeosortase/exosortase family protein [Pyrinomonadaceae bacterium]|nr:archaeosortase/exosortase family protein [Pyrinomonadaceae bacterium]